jgi:hypothetical protein
MLAGTFGKPYNTANCHSSNCDAVATPRPIPPVLCNSAWLADCKAKAALLQTDDVAVFLACALCPDSRCRYCWCRCSCRFLQPFSRWQPQLMLVCARFRASWTISVSNDLESCSCTQCGCYAIDPSTHLQQRHWRV